MSEEYHYQILTYFSHDFKGTFIDIGMENPIIRNNTFLLELNGWEGICIEPNKRYCQMAQGIRKNVINCACGKEDLSDQEFTIVNICAGEEGAVSSLKVDQRLIESHKMMINHITKTKVDVKKLDTILEDLNFTFFNDKGIDFISIDTENTELDVLKGFDIARWNPTLMIIENNFDEPFIEDYLSKLGYKKDKRYHINDFYSKIE